MNVRKKFNLTATWKKIDRKITEHNQRIGPTGKKKYGKTCKERIKCAQRAGIRDIALAYIRAHEKGASRANHFWVTLSYLAKMSEDTKTDRTAGNHVDKAIACGIFVRDKLPGRKNFGSGNIPCVVIIIDDSLLAWDDPEQEKQFKAAAKSVDKSVEELSEAQAAALVKAALEANRATPS